MMLNTILKLAALASFVASVTVLAIYVPDLDLIAVLIIVAVMAIYDFLIRPIRIRNGNNRQR
ncbi:hypothetical protein [Dongia deserti]|uniref:hypothetical protein n=1 Tax=Dongia deserti TaxID=2268030 RepID=UPI000E6574F6|nr:hypothetical protein [Dongia deserti]